MFVSFLPKFYSILIAYGASGPTASGLGGVLFLMDFLFSDAASLFFFYLPLAGHRFDNETPVEEVVRAQANYTVIAHNNPISPSPPPPTWADASASRRCPEGLGPLHWHEFMLCLAIYAPITSTRLSLSPNKTFPQLVHLMQSAHHLIDVIVPTGDS